MFFFTLNGALNCSRVADKMARRPGSYTGGMGMSSMLKEGSKHFSGVEEATLKNIEACKQLAATVRTSLGPNGARARGG